MAKRADPQATVKTTLRPRGLWIRARHRAVDDDLDMQHLVAKALEFYLAKGGRP